MKKSGGSSAEETELYWLSVIGKSLSQLCLEKAGLSDASIGEQAKLLSGLGLRRSHIGALLNTTEETVRVELANALKTGRSKRGKQTKKRRKDRRT